MITTVLKHCIYEYCIGLIFKSIRRNFYQKQITVPKAGQRYKQIILDLSHGFIVLNNCEIHVLSDLDAFYDMANDYCYSIYYNPSVPYNGVLKSLQCDFHVREYMLNQMTFIK